MFRPCVDSLVELKSIDSITVISSRNLFHNIVQALSASKELNFSFNLNPPSNYVLREVLLESNSDN
jgi:hypothetical protein